MGSPQSLIRPHPHAMATECASGMCPRVHQWKLLRAGSIATIARKTAYLFFRRRVAEITCLVKNKQISQIYLGTNDTLLSKYIFASMLEKNKPMITHTQRWSMLHKRFPCIQSTTADIVHTRDVRKNCNISSSCLIFGTYDTGWSVTQGLRRWWYS